MAKKLSTLAHSLDFKEEVEYFDYCIDSFINGNKSQCRDLFAAMRKDDRKSLLQYIQTREIGQKQEIYQFYFNLL